MIPPNTGILLTQIGTPNALTEKAVRQYLKKFLTDPRVIQLPRILWWPILYGFILPFRPKRSLKLYQEIWTEKGSPLLVYSENIREKLEKNLEIPVALGMHYSDPSIPDALEWLSQKNVGNIILLPLFPQYSDTTTASSLDAVNKIACHTIYQYHDHPAYIQAMVQSIRQFWNQHGRGEHLLFSYHGIPESYTKKGDPYASLCQKTTTLITQSLQLKNEEWSISFQSRIGKTKWAGPYTDRTLQNLGKRGISHLQVICPGFSADCLETLEEINIRGKRQFQAAGGKIFQYIPALNDSKEHIEMLTKVIYSSIGRALFT